MLAAAASPPCSASLSLRGRRFFACLHHHRWPTPLLVASAASPASTPTGCFRCCPRCCCPRRGQGERRGHGRGHLRRGRGRGHLVASAAARRHLVGRPRKTLSVALFDATRRHLVGRSHLSMIRESRSSI